MRKKKVLLASLLLIGVLLAACSKEEEDTPVFKEAPKGDIVIEEEEKEAKDLNLEGELYTEDNRPEDSQEILLYLPSGENLDLEEVVTYGNKEDIDINYLLNTIAHNQGGIKLNFEGELVGRTAKVFIGDLGNLTAWMSNMYPDLYEDMLYNGEEESSAPIIDISRYDFAMLAMESMDKTLKENLDIDTVVFYEFDEPLELKGSFVKDGLYFRKNGSPRFFAGGYMTYNGMNEEELVEYFSNNVKDISGESDYKKSQMINMYLAENEL